jgi:hypothetical protein
MTTIPPDAVAPPVAEFGPPVVQQYAPIPVRRGAWILPLLALLALSAIGAGIGLYLHRMHGITEVEAGQCFANLDDITDPNQQTLLEHRVDCAEPHTAEVIAVINRPSEVHEGSILDWPHVSAAGNVVVGAAAENDPAEWPEETCAYRFNDYIGVSPDDSDFVLLPFPMFAVSTPVADSDELRQALDEGDWKLVCIVGHEPRTGSVRNYSR